MYQLPELKYGYGDLEPHFDEATMRLHHLKHHQAYLDKLNAALAPYPELAAKEIGELIKNLAAVPEAIREAVRNHGGGHLNHSLFWNYLTPASTANQPSEKVTAALQTFGGVEEFKKQFKEFALTRFGSGWAWLVRDSGQLKIVSTANQDNPASQGQEVIFGLDVWEHAYYLKYQNRRADYVDAFWSVLDWQAVEALL